MLESTLLFMSHLDPILIYLILFLFAFTENIFPPSPSDVVVVVGASLIATTTLEFIPVLLITSFGSSLGFMLMYLVGKLFGEKIIRSGKLKFITQEGLSNTDIWFNKWGYKLIVANRFLPGTRSVISFFAGVYELELIKTFVFSTISAFAWNVLIIEVGMFLGNNVESIDYYLSTYSLIGSIIAAVVILYFALKYYLKRKRN
ncbi:MAG: DedA family protein [Bacteroidetes bacterium]|nr:DedA family protein [Bacteroidota bacterium]MBU1113685.1 DedA family protein [Bacteroidota bacterium]MBU1799096.1 DedA family protein [Bacteroidota bacterium]